MAYQINILDNEVVDRATAPRSERNTNYFTKSGISVHTHPRIRSNVTFRYFYNGINYYEVDTAIKKVKDDYFISCGKRYYFDKIKNLKNYMTKETVTKDMIKEWF